jgi:hypothetical protein
MLVLLVVSGIQIAMLGVLGEYLWRNLEETRRRPRFIVETVLQDGREVPSGGIGNEAPDGPARTAGRGRGTSPA